VEKVAGRELDALVAEKVMGLSITTWGDPNSPIVGYDKFTRDLPHYSTSISAAWEVVEKLIMIGSNVGHTWTMEYDLEDLAWDVGYKGWDYDTGWSWEMVDWPVTAPTAPHAICLAALKAVGEG